MENKKSNKMANMLINAVVVIVLMVILGAVSGSQGIARYFMGFLVFPIISFVSTLIYSRFEDFGVILPILYALVSTIILLIMHLGFWVILTMLLTLILAVAGSYIGAKMRK